MNKFIFDENNDKGHSDSNLNESYVRQLKQIF